MEEMDQYEKEAYERRKKDVVEYRNKKRTSNIFMVGVSLFEIAVSFILFFVFFVTGIVLLAKVFVIEIESNPNALAILLLVSFVLAIVLGFIIYKKFVRLLIKKMNLETKLTEEVLDHYRSTKEVKEKMNRKLEE